MEITAEQKKKALAQIKAVYDDGVADINGREYKFLGTTHAIRRKIFAYSTKIQKDLGVGDFSFLASSEFVAIEKEINKMVTFQGNLLKTIMGEDGKSKNHWDEYPEDYVKFITCAMGVIGYPFLKGSLTA